MAGSKSIPDTEIAHQSFDGRLSSNRQSFAKKELEWYVHLVVDIERNLEDRHLIEIEGQLSLFEAILPNV
jgi:hypothetical protein